MTTPLVVVGAGGFGRETLDVIEALNCMAPEPIYELLGVVDANPSMDNIKRLGKRGVSYLGTETAWLAAGHHVWYIVGIGNPLVRQYVAEQFRLSGAKAGTAIHPAAVIGSSVTIGAGTVICGGVQISTNVEIGMHVQLNPNATIGHDSQILDFVSINPAAVISGDVSVGMRSLVGAGAVVLPRITLGADSVVGASACVVRDVDAGRVVKGVPAK